MMSEPVTASPRVTAVTARGMLRDLLALTKPRITLIVIATSAAGMAIAPMRIQATAALLSLVGTTLIVAAANVLNMWWERETDGLMARTAKRPLPAGRMAPDLALGFGIALAASSVPMLLAVNVLTAALGVVALVTYVFLYTPLKRHTSWALWVGAIPGAMPPLMGWTSATGQLLPHAGAAAPHAAGSLPLVSPAFGGLLLFAFLFAWQLPHFNAIALFRADDYRKAGLRVVSVERGEQSAKRHIAAYSALLVAVSLALAASRVAGSAFELSAALLGALFLALGLGGLSRTTGSRWAKGVFAYSVVYLTLLLTVLALDRTWV